MVRDKRPCWTCGKPGCIAATCPAKPKVGKGGGKGGGNRSAVKAIEDALPFFGLQDGQGPGVQAAVTDGFQVAKRTFKPTPRMASLADFVKTNDRNTFGLLAKDRQRYNTTTTTTTDASASTQTASPSGSTRTASALTRPLTTTTTTVPLGSRPRVPAVLPNRPACWTASQASASSSSPGTMPAAVHRDVAPSVSHVQARSSVGSATCFATQHDSGIICSFGSSRRRDVAPSVSHVQDRSLVGSSVRLSLLPI